MPPVSLFFTRITRPPSRSAPRAGLRCSPWPRPGCRFTNTRRVKAAATGRGGAQKAQVGFMKRAMLGLTENPPPDAADALAVALTHTQNTGVRSKPKEI